jgi:hypothetical protein
MHKLLQSYLFFKIFQVRLLVQCYLWHVFEEISNFKTAQLHCNILVQSRMVCTQIVVSHLTKYTTNLVKVAKYRSFALLINSMLWEDSHALNCVFSFVILQDSNTQIKFCTSTVNPTRCTNFSNLFYFGITLYMFRMVFPSSIRSSRLYIQKQVLLPAC